MKTRSFFALPVIAVASAVLLCACGPSIPKVTVISKQSVNSPTQTTTTTTTTVATTTDLGNSSSSVQPAGSSTAAKPTVVTDAGSSATGTAIASLAASLVGTPYTTNGNGPDSFDNPGFVVYCYKQNGFTVPRRATAMTTYGKEIYPDEIQPGDILLFCNEIGGDADFAGIYIGNNRFISCNNPERPTQEQRLDDSDWGPRFLTARRFVQE